MASDEFRDASIDTAWLDHHEVPPPDDDVPRVMGGLGTAILTTSHGVMTGKDAVKAGVGGEVLCNIW